MKDILPIFSTILSLCILSHAHVLPQPNQPQHHYEVRGSERNTTAAPSGTRSSLRPIFRIPVPSQNTTYNDASATAFVKAVKPIKPTSKKVSGTANTSGAKPSSTKAKTSAVKSSSTKAKTSAVKSSSSASKATSSAKTSTSSKASSSTKTTSSFTVATSSSMDYSDARWQNRLNCQIFDPPDNKATSDQCYNACSTEIEAAKKEDRITSYGCVAFTPLNEAIKWYKWPGSSRPLNYTMGKCSCDNALINELAKTIIDALPAIAQIGCFIIMSSLRLIFEKALDAIPGPGQAINAGMKALIYAANLVKHAYDASQAPVDAFDFWLKPCGGSDLVPQQLKDAFGILEQAGSVIDFKPPKNIKKGSGKKGDAANPK